MWHPQWHPPPPPVVSSQNWQKCFNLTRELNDKHISVTYSTVIHKCDPFDAGLSHVKKNNIKNALIREWMDTK